MGSCANGGGYYHYSYSVVGAVIVSSQLIYMFRLSTYCRGLLGIIQLQNKIRGRSVYERDA